MLVLTITPTIGEFLIDEKEDAFGRFDYDKRKNVFEQLKKDFLEELQRFLKEEIKVHENSDSTLHAQLPFLGSVRLEWLKMLHVSHIIGGIVQEVDISHEFEADKKIRSVITELSKKYPQRYKLVVKPKK